MAYIGQTPTSSPPDFSSSDSSSSTLLDTSSSPPCDPGCLCGPYYSFIVFANLSVPSPAPRYYIGTTWRVFYPFQVKQGLNHAGFQVLDSGYPSCGYTLEDTTSARGIVRGWYGINGSGSQPDGQSDIGVQVDGILRSTYPYVEIYLLASILLFPVFLLSVIVSTSFLSLSLCASDRKTNRKQNTSTIKGLGVRFSRWTRLSRWRSKPSPHIAKLPAELQLHIMSYLDYRSAVNLRHTSRYYSQIISLADISALRTRDGESNAPGTDQGLRSCVRCLSLLPFYAFDTDQLGSGVSNQQRQCLQCSLRGGGYSHGGIVRGQLFCAHCRTLKNASNEKVPDSSWQWKLNDLEPAWRWCRECLDCRSRLIAANLLIRLPQFAIALVIFGLANSGAHSASNPCMCSVPITTL